MSSSPKLIVLLLLGFLITGCAPKPTQWEYKTLTVEPSKKDASLRTEGEQSWELVSSQESKSGSEARIKELEIEQRDLERDIAILSDENIKIMPKGGKPQRVFMYLRELLGSGGLTAKEMDRIRLDADTARTKLKTEKGVSENERILSDEYLTRIIGFAIQWLQIEEQITTAESLTVKLVFKRQKS